MLPRPRRLVSVRAGAATAAALALTLVSQASPPTLRRLGAFDFDPGESSPVVFRGRPHIVESIASCYPGHAGRWDKAFEHCPSYLRVVDLASGHVVANITGSCNHSFSSAIVVQGGSSSAGDTLHVFATRWARWQAPHAWCPKPAGTGWHGVCGTTPSECAVDVFSSGDPALLSWASREAVRPGFSAYNTDVAAVGGATVPGVGAVTYAMAVEHGGGPVGWESQLFVTNASSPVEGWRIVQGAVAPVACPCLRYIPEDGMFYMIGSGAWTARRAPGAGDASGDRRKRAASGAGGVAPRGAEPRHFQAVYVHRSTNLATWVQAPRPLIAPNSSGNDTKPVNGSDVGLLTWVPPEANGVAATFRSRSWDQSAGDPDAIEVDAEGGRRAVLVFWTAGDQATWGFGELGWASTTLRDFLSAPFGAGDD